MLVSQHSATPLDGNFAVPQRWWRQLIATTRQGISPMELTFVAVDPESAPQGSPTLYKTDRGSWVVQGWIVTDPGALAQLKLPDGETAVEIPDRMIPFFTQQ